MSDAAIQKGTSLIIAFGSFSFTGYVPEDGLTWSKPAGNITPVTDEHGAMMTKIIQDPRDAFKMTLIVKTTGGTTTPAIAGATITILDPTAGSSLACFCNSDEVSFSRGYLKRILDLVKEGSMTYT